MCGSVFFILRAEFLELRKTAMMRKTAGKGCDRMGHKDDAHMDEDPDDQGIIKIHGKGKGRSI